MFVLHKFGLVIHESYIIETPRVMSIFGLYRSFLYQTKH